MNKLFLYFAFILIGCFGAKPSFGQIDKDDAISILNRIQNPDTLISLLPPKYWEVMKKREMWDDPRIRWAKESKKTDSLKSLQQEYKTMETSFELLELSAMEESEHYYYRIGCTKAISKFTYYNIDSSKFNLRDPGSVGYIAIILAKSKFTNQFHFCWLEEMKQGELDSLGFSEKKLLNLLVELSGKETGLESPELSHTLMTLLDEEIIRINEKSNLDTTSYEYAFKTICDFSLEYEEKKWITKIDYLGQEYAAIRFRLAHTIKTTKSARLNGPINRIRKYYHPDCTALFKLKKGKWILVYINTPSSSEIPTNLQRDVNALKGDDAIAFDLCIGKAWQNKHFMKIPLYDNTFDIVHKVQEGIDQFIKSIHSSEIAEINGLDIDRLKLKGYALHKTSNVLIKKNTHNKITIQVSLEFEGDMKKKNQIVYLVLNEQGTILSVDRTKTLDGRHTNCRYFDNSFFKASTIY